MRKLLIFFLLCSNLTFSQHNEKEVLEYQKELNESYLNIETTPLKEDELKDFKGLNFYPYNEKFVVKATLERLKNQPVFKMPTSGKNQANYKRYGILHFTINDQKFQLEVYQNIDLIKMKGYKKHLFLPFIDETSGNETYGAGRYLDIEIPKGKEIVLDFNKAYHPYCAYTIGYSCPITPDVNFLKTEILAGVKF
ncbi:hypothetical protein SAMN05421741_10325 [Paenimyroides ummariense]|uniref:DUF1684 domain-containing protein n=1 Tax=Paenimyroides ummariense TaxID=913024 RepID=A0A1I4XK15_9FLAO|nr:DUF1684 domain-containing protein [Paenimyroides ummariense]SFN26207.1 hypothetical protein SAMN05421741_10325 [Paenimyroides ummariense]